MPKMPELAKIEPTNVFGNFGNSGTGGGRENKGDPIVDLLALWHWPLPMGPPLRNCLTRRSSGRSAIRADGMPATDRQAANRGQHASGCAAAAWGDAISRAGRPAAPRDTRL
jgi:hypothetical protein